MSEALDKPSKSALPWLLALNFLLLGSVLWLQFEQTKKSQNHLQGLTTVVAKVNGKPLYARDLLSASQFIKALPDTAALRFALEKMIRSELVAQQSLQKKISLTQIDELLKITDYQFPDLAARNSALTTAGLSENDLRERLLRQLRSEAWLLQNSDSQPTETESRAWFATHPEMANFPDVVQASHFAAIYPPRGNPAERLAKNDLIRDAQKRLSEGISFPQLIDAFSDDPAKKTTQGSLAWFRRERLETALTEVAFTVPPEQVSQPIETRFGWHLLLVHAHQSAITLLYEDVAAEVRQRCCDEQNRKNIEALVTNLRQRAKVEILDPTLRQQSL